MERCKNWTTRAVQSVKRLVSLVCRLLLGTHAVVACIVIAGQAVLSHPALHHYTFFAGENLLPYQKHVVLPWVLTGTLVAVVSIAAALVSILFKAICCLCGQCKRKTKITPPAALTQATEKEKDAPPKGSAKKNNSAVRQRRSYAVLHEFTKN